MRAWHNKNTIATTTVTTATTHPGMCENINAAACTHRKCWCAPAMPRSHEAAAAHKLAHECLHALFFCPENPLTCGRCAGCDCGCAAIRRAPSRARLQANTQAAQTTRTGAGYCGVVQDNRALKTHTHHTHQEDASMGGGVLLKGTKAQSWAPSQSISTIGALHGPRVSARMPGRAVRDAAHTILVCGRSALTALPLAPALAGRAGSSGPPPGHCWGTAARRTARSAGGWGA